jgi:hypothetical protein
MEKEHVFSTVWGKYPTEWESYWLCSAQRKTYMYATETFVW